MNLKLVISGLMAVMLVIPGMAIAGDIVVIGNKSVAESRLSKNDIKKIYLGTKTTWSDNQKIVFVIQDNTSISDEFLKTYVKKSASQFSSYWKSKVFTGQGTPPKSFASDEELVQFIAQTEGAMGYVSSNEGLDNVKILKVD
jgi:ABC-type phosphate transport system substrate-binding protein